MAQRRMFSPDIVASDAFLDMPVSSQVLYFHLGMRADDDGFVSPRSVMRTVGVSEDDLKVLIGKRFILPFESGVVVIKHWLIHNLIRADLYKETLYKEEKKLLGLNDNGAYTEIREGVNLIKEVESPKWLKIRRGELRTANVPQTALRLGKDRLGKDSIDTHVESEFLNFWKEYPKKTGKGEAEKSWNKITPSRELSEVIISSVKAHRESKNWKKEEGRFIPLPATFLNQRRYEDEIDMVITNTKYSKYAS